MVFLYPFPTHINNCNINCAFVAIQLLAFRQKYFSQKSCCNAFIYTFVYSIRVCSLRVLFAVYLYVWTFMLVKLAFKTVKTVTWLYILWVIDCISISIRDRLYSVFFFACLPTALFVTHPRPVASGVTSHWRLRYFWCVHRCGSDTLARNISQYSSFWSFSVCSALLIKILLISVFVLYCSKYFLFLLNSYYLEIVLQHFLNNKFETIYQINHIYFFLLSL